MFFLKSVFKWNKTAYAYCTLHMFIALHQSVKGVLVYEQGLWPGPRGSVGFGPQVLLWEAGICLPSKPFTTSCSTRSLTQILLVLFKGQTASKYTPHHRTMVWIAECFSVWPSRHLKSVLRLKYGLELMFCQFKCDYELWMSLHKEQMYPLIQLYIFQQVTSNVFTAPVS